MTDSEILALIESKLEPLRIEITGLKQKLEVLLPTEPEPMQAEVVVEPILPEVAPERADFQKFLQRGLEQEQREYSEEALDAKPEPKKGWNPFKR
jgi:hypothetical protein